jgi:hypothetical protein
MARDCCVVMEAHGFSLCFKIYQMISVWMNNNWTLTEIRSVQSAANPVSGPEMQQL